jgi:pimeloyl-ACP methyl ester carboxylesterase
VQERDLELPDGRTVHVYDTGPEPGAGPARLTVFWHHGTPNIGPPPAPLLPESARLGVRWVSHDRPGYGGSTARPGRDVASVAEDAARIADALGVDRFAVMGHSGGGPHALACAARLPDRVVGVVCLAGLAPYDAPGLAWFAGMSDADVASLRAARDGREARIRHEHAGAGTETPLDPGSDPGSDPGPTTADLATLAGPWSWLESVTGPEAGAGLDGLVDDDVAFVTPWGFDPADVLAPTLLVHGVLDRVVPSTHSVWLDSRCPRSQLRLGLEDGHVSVLESAAAALEWLVAAEN